MNKSEIQIPFLDESVAISSRRKFLKQAAYGSFLAMAGSRIASASIRPYPSHKTLALENTNTGDKVKLTYFEQGNYVEDALEEINYLLRDYHNDAVHPIDTALLDQLYDLKQTLGVSKPIHIISGYRSPYTNAGLRKRSHAVAKHSLHMEGRAIDIRISGVNSRTIRNAALIMGRGGVGYYPRADFVHLDTGEFRTW